VLDVAMPGLNGLELQQELAARGSTLPIVFLTGHGDVPTSVRAMKRGAADFLTKPVDENDLLAAIRSAFEKGRAIRRHARTTRNRAAPCDTHAAGARSARAHRRRQAQQASRGRARHRGEDRQGPPCAGDGEDAGALARRARTPLPSGPEFRVRRTRADAALD
jgi:DNA-binding NtrC family response regulator